MIEKHGICLSRSCNTQTRAENYRQDFCSVGIVCLYFTVVKDIQTRTLMQFSVEKTFPYYSRKT